MYKKSRKKLLVVLPEAFRQDISLLTSIYEKQTVHCRTVFYPTQPPPIHQFSDIAATCDAILLLSPFRRAPSTILPSPFLQINKKKRLPVAMLPIKTGDCINRFAALVQKVHSRANNKMCMALLSQRHPRYLNVASRVETVLSRIEKFSVVRWTSEQVYKKEMVGGLQGGIGCALFMGHGRPVGWAGYYGTRLHDFETSEKTIEPMGALFSLCCLTASRKRTGISFSEGMVTNGHSAASFGAVRKTNHLDNTRWAIRICYALKEGARTVGEVVNHAAPPHPSSWEPYRIIGDPFAPVYSTLAAEKKALSVSLYP